MKYITCDRCREHMLLKFFTKSKRRCDGCIRIIEEHQAAKKLSGVNHKGDTRKTPIFKNYDASPSATKARDIAQRREAIIERLALKAELEELS